MKSHKEALTIFYDEATEDYLFWSKDYNMHFGYYRSFKNNPFKRDTMLNEMNKQVYDRLGISGIKSHIADLGCGMGATMAYGLKRYPLINVTGLTLSAFQETEGNKLLKGGRGKIINMNYNHTGFETNSLDGLIAIESFCHSGHSYQTLQEAHRILKPKGRLVIADAFLKKPKNKLGFTAKYAYTKLCESWKLDALGDIKTVKKNLEIAGFRNIRVENASCRVAPSVLHVPFAITGFVIRKKLKGKLLKAQTLNNLKGSFYALLSGMHLMAFGYYIITCEKI